MFGSISGIHCHWPGEDRLRCDNERVRTRGPKTSFGTGILSSRPFGETRISRAATFFCLANGLSIVAATAILLVANTAWATPSFVQGNYADPQTPQATVNVTYTRAQAAGDLNVVVVGWNDTNAQVNSVTDDNGNTYQLVLGPTQLTSAVSQSIYCAKNIAPAASGANVVTVVFTQAALYPDIRVLEYSGIDPLNPVDVTAAATGTGTTTDSGSVATTNATDLLLGANTMQATTSGPAGSVSFFVCGSVFFS
jgi:hypothetical protein